MLFIAFVAGIALQLFVIETPGVRDVFSTFNLNIWQWLITLCLSVLPLFVHECIVFMNWVKKFKTE